jgi:uncharacterized protein (UPF0332 family)/predicted nucleotidyltransferase
MEFPLTKPSHESTIVPGHVPHRPTDTDREIAYAFAARIKREMGTIIRAIILFGSVAEHETRPVPLTLDPSGDIDLMIVLDDVSVQLTDELVTAYRLLAEKTLADISPRLHLTTVSFTTFWEYVRAADPVIVNVLRSGHPIIDTGFVEPLKVLLHQGRIRPTEEAVWNYYLRAPQALQSSQMHLIQAVYDLYWACIDAAHAALMAADVIPRAPKEVAHQLRETYVQKGVLEEHFAATMEGLYTLSKDITHRRVSTISAEHYDELYVQAKAFVDRMRSFLPGINANRV